LIKPPDVEKLRVLYRKWGFKGMLAALEESAPGDQQILI
jgi:hypothetical protein